jgi:hypothetical protein
VFCSSCCRFAASIRASLDTEAPPQLPASHFRHPDGAASLGALDPIELEEPLRQRHAELAGQVRPALRPVVAGLARARRLLDPEVDEELRAGLGKQEHVAFALDQAAVDQRVGDPDPELPCQVPVAGARGAERARAVGLAETADLGARRQRGERLDRGRDLRPGEPVVTVATAPLDREEACLPQLRQVLRHGRARDPRDFRQLARRERPAIGQLDQDGGAARVRHQHRGGGDVDLALGLGTRRHAPQSRTPRIRPGPNRFGPTVSP